ncbi:MAG: protoporphyrinogen oxidase [Symploca sp. SIO2G7]|nr:protoporphyrinogen oxidase [Symploca sp. SIO2G7]
MATQKLQPIQQTLDTLIVGAGISGLSLAYALNKQLPQQDRNSSQRILVAEQRGRVGGNIVTAEVDNFLWEEGPNSFSPNPHLLKLVLDVGLESELLLSNSRLPRFVYWQGHLHPVPTNPWALTKSNLLSNPGKLRALLGAIGLMPPPSIGAKRAQKAEEETVKQFFYRHLGHEVTERLVAPFVSGVYAGDPQQLSVAAAFPRIVKLESTGGSLIAGAIRSRLQNSQPPSDKNSKPPVGSLASFKQGLRSLPHAIAQHLDSQIKLNWRLTKLQRNPEHTYTAEFATPEGQQQIEAKTVVFTSPSYITAKLLQPLQPTLSQLLESIPYPPVAVVVLAYPKTATTHNLQGFGHLVPRGQGIQTLGTIWSSSLFPDRAPKDWHLLTTFIGGATNPEIAELSDEQIVEIVDQNLRKILLNSEAPPPKVLAVHKWVQAIPQYTLGHPRKLDDIQKQLKQLPGVFLRSNYIDGVSLGDCVRLAEEKAQEVKNWLDGESLK